MSQHTYSEDDIIADLKELDVHQLPMMQKIARKTASGRGGRTQQLLKQENAELKEAIVQLALDRLTANRRTN